MTATKELTDRQAEIYRYIDERYRETGFGVAVRDIGARFQIRTPNGVLCHLKALQDKGWIVRGHLARSIRPKWSADAAGLIDRCRRLPADRYGEAAEALDRILARTEGRT